MRAEHLFEAIGLVDDRLVEEAADACGSGGHWKSWAALAACLAIVVGIGSVSMSILFRGCGAKSAAPESSNMTDSAGADWNGISQDVGSVDAPADAPADMPADADLPAEEPTAPPESPEGDPEDGQGGLPLTADQPGLTFRRETRTEPVDDESQQVLDSYWVTNTTEETITANFRYTVDAAPESGETLEIQVAGKKYEELELEVLDRGATVGTFPVTIGAGESIEITATYLQSAD